MRTLATLFLGIAGYSLNAQWELPVQRITTNEGLSDNSITSLYEDAAGFIWVGTEHGLNRYDGNRVDQFTRLDAQLINDHITAITGDGEGNLWATTRASGLIRIDKERRSVWRAQHKGNEAGYIPTDRLKCVFDLNDSTLLISAEQYPLIFLDKRTLRFSYWTDSTSISPVLASDRPTTSIGWVHNIIPLDQDRLWIGFLNNHQTLIVDRTTGVVTKRMSSTRTEAQTYTCAAVVGQHLYIGGWQNGIDLVDLGNNEPPSIIPIQDEVNGIIHRDNALLLTTKKSGLLRLELSTGSVSSITHRRSDPTSLSSDRTTCLLIDGQGNTWIGTANGLNVHAPSIWRMQGTPITGPNTEVEAELHCSKLVLGRDSTLRLLTSNGIYRTTTNARTITHVPIELKGRSFQPTSYEQLSDGTVLLGTETGSLFYDPARDMVTGHLPMLEFNGSEDAFGTMYQVRRTFHDQLKDREVILIGALGFGISRVDAHTHRYKEVAPCGTRPSLTTWMQLNALERDQRGRYWAATAAGVMRVDIHQADIEEGTRFWTIAEGLPVGEITSVLIVGDSVWCATTTGGLARIVDDHITSFPKDSTVGNATVRINGLACDHQRRIWCATDHGLLRFDQRDHSWTDVPINVNTQGRKADAISTLLDGRIAFSANNTLFTFDPNAFDTLPDIPAPYLVHVTSGGMPVPMDLDLIELSYRNSTIDVSLSALYPVTPGPLVFLYRWEGEHHWNITDATTPIRYAGVPIGKHRLLVRVKDAFGRTGPDHVLLSVIVTGPFWQQWWFYGLALLIITIGLYALYRYRLSQALKLQAVRNRIASDLHDEVGSSLSSITIGSQLAAKLSTSENEKVKAIMERIGETSSESLRSMSDIVWAIDPKNDQGEALVKRMRRIAQELLESKGIDVSFSVSGGVEELKLPMNARKEMVLIYKEAVHNASKYSTAKLVQVSLHRRIATLAVSIKDDGKGFDVSLHPDGHGLGSMQRRAIALGGELQLKSAPGLGTFVGIEVDLTRIRD